MPPIDTTSRTITLHGHEVSYREAGEGEPIVLLHGITGSSETWLDVFAGLAERYSVIAPDLLGHGHSAKPRGDYSLGAYASGIRDLLAALGYENATVVGHSLGGGIAMQMAYQFPERCDRLVLVSSGGLGGEVNLLLRAATLPGSELVLPVLVSAGLVDSVNAVIGALGRVGLRGGPDLEEMWRGFSSLADSEARQAFLHTLRSIVDITGQRVSATDRLYLAAEVPTLLIWGERDRIIPLEHGIAAHDSIPGARLEVFENAGHFPYRDDPKRFVDALDEFMVSTEPAAADDDRLRDLLLAGA